MELVFIGTGAASPSLRRGFPALVLLFDNQEDCFLFDCGEGTLHRLLQENIRLSRIRHIFLSHLHGDHFFGVLALLSARNLQTDKPLDLYGPEGIRSFVEEAVRVCGMKLRFPLKIFEYSPGIIFEDATVTLETKPLHHRVLSYGFAICEKDYPGALQIHKLQARNVSFGPHFRELKKGQDVCLSDGTLLKAKDFLSEARKGRKVCILGDTAFCDNSILLAQDADVLVHEATFRVSEEELAKKYLHSTSKDAARVAVSARVKQLFLTHISTRYDKEEQEFEEEAQEVFPATTVASDGDRYRVNKPLGVCC